MFDTQKIGEKIAQFRRKKNMTQMELAEEMSVDVYKRQLLKCFRKCKGSTILSLFVKEADHRCRYGTHGFFSIAPIRFDAAVKSAVRMPSSSDVQNWKAPLQNKLCVLCMLCLCQADYLHTSSIFQLLCTMC